jgi:hypothetical protein
MYAKMFASMFDGSLVSTGPWEALVTFQQLIILADREGWVDMTLHAISRRTGIPIDILEKGIPRLLEPDAHSRSEAEGGRRIIPIDERRPWGWKIVNYQHYRQIRTAEDRREYMKEYQRQRRCKQKVLPGVDGINNLDSKQCQPKQPIADADADADAESIKEKRILTDSQKEKVNVKNGKVEEINQQPNSRRTRKSSKTKREDLEAFVVTEEIRRWAHENGLPNPDEHMEEFKDHWRGRDDIDLRCDWPATFRNRLRYIAKHPEKFTGVNGNVSSFLGECHMRVNIPGTYKRKDCGKPGAEKIGKHAYCQEHLEEARRKVLSHA